MEHTITVGSYYQSLNMQCRGFKADTYKMIDSIVENIPGQGKTLLISTNNLRLLENEVINNSSSKYSESELDYLTALYCDIEVAIQEKRLINMAEKYGYLCNLDKISQKPNLRYLEEFPIPDMMELAEENLVQGDVYVINTHGKQQQLDGPYNQAVNMNPIPQRIVIDACSSALASFPVKGSGSKSVLELVADLAIRKSRPDTLEVVGYKRIFTTTDTTLTACAVFAKKELVDNKDLQLITLSERKASSGQQHIKNQQKIIMSKLSSFTNYNNKNKDDEYHVQRLQGALIDVCSKLAARYITKKSVLGIENQENMEFLLKFTKHDEAHQKDVINTAINELMTSKKTNIIKELRNNLKVDRKEYFSEMTDISFLNYIAKTVLETFSTINDEVDFRSSMGALEVAASESHDFLKSDNVATSPIG